MFSNYTTFLNPSSEANRHHLHNHHQQLPFSSTFLHHQDPPQPLEQFLQLQPVSQYSDGPQTPIDVVVSRSRSMRSPPTVVSGRPVKKDRHSKIHTAQGLRDRRVRLSIGIARRFFDLQDMLRFDKASKTLEWLLGNSRNAIKNLGRRTITASLSSSSSSSSGDLETAKKMKRAGNDLDALARESRAKARARARERTLEKLTSRASSSQLKANDSSQNYLSASNSKPSTLKDQEVPIADSGNTPSPVHDQQNSVIAREGSYFKNFDYYCPNLPSSWDINSAINVYLCTEAAIHGKKT